MENQGKCVWQPAQIKLPSLIHKQRKYHFFFQLQFNSTQTALKKGKEEEKEEREDGEEDDKEAKERKDVGCITESHEEDR